MQTYLKLPIVTTDRNQFTLFSVQGGILHLVRKSYSFNILMGDYFYPIADWELGPPIWSNAHYFVNIPLITTVSNNLAYFVLSSYFPNI